MKKKCYDCRHYFSDPAMPRIEVCGSEDVLSLSVTFDDAIDLQFGRQICDREGDGHFVYFEPIEIVPSAGAVFEGIPYSRPSEELRWECLQEVQDVPLVQITRTRPQAMAAGGAA